MAGSFTVACSRGCHLNFGLDAIEEHFDPAGAADTGTALFYKWDKTPSIL